METNTDLGRAEGAVNPDENKELKHKHTVFAGNQVEERKMQPAVSNPVDIR